MVSVFKSLDKKSKNIKNITHKKGPENVFYQFEYIWILCLFMCVIVIKIGFTALGYRKRFVYILKTKQNYLYSNTQSFRSLSVVLWSYCPLYADVFFQVYYYIIQVNDLWFSSFFTILRFHNETYAQLLPETLRCLPAPYYQNKTHNVYPNHLFTSVSRDIGDATWHYILMYSYYVHTYNDLPTYAHDVVRENFKLTRDVSNIYYSN